MKEIQLHRAKKSENEKRIFEIQGYIIDGEQNYLIINKLTNKWNISERQARNYLKKAYSNWATTEGISIEEKRAAKVAELKELARSIKKKYKGTPTGINAIIQVQKEISKLEGLYAPRVHIVEGNVNNPVLHEVEIKIINTGYLIANSEETIDI